MKLKTIIAISASIFLVGANLFVISAKQGSVNCKNLLSKTFSFNHFAYADDPGFISGSYPTGKAYPDGIADCSSMEIEEYSIDVKINSMAVGDYQVSDEVVIERKTAGDFVSSIIDKRLFES